jgi:hypothetical protein
MVRALEWPLTGVDSEVVVEVVELPEVHLAVIEVALEDGAVPVGPRISVLEDPEVARARAQHARVSSLR